MRTTTKPTGSGATQSASPRNASSASDPKTTTGAPGSPAQAVHAQRSTSTVAPPMGGTAAPRSMRRASSRSGTSSSCSTACRLCTPRPSSRSPVPWRTRASTPAWDWSAWPWCSKGWRTCMRPTRCGPSSTAPRNSPEPPTPPQRTLRIRIMELTCACA